MTTTAIITLLLFVVIYQVVRGTAYNIIDERLLFESGDVLDDIDLAKDTLFFTDTSEWSELEHKAVEVYPTFMQIVDAKGNIVKKTSNLKTEKLEVYTDASHVDNFDTELSGRLTRQTQAVIISNSGIVLGRLSIAVPLEGAALTVENLRRVLLISYPVVLIVLFFASRAIAGRGIRPLQKITAEAEKISNENLDYRITLPKNTDEIHKLAETVNQLLNRLEDAVLREKQFTADASHELRTPLSVIKGTLEVLMRKPRTAEHYNEKISFCIKEVDRITGLIEQLLTLARYESGNLVPVIRQIELCSSVRYTIERIKEFIDSHGVRIQFDETRTVNVKADPSMLDVILENLLSNAIKYSGTGTSIDVTISIVENDISLFIKDYGIGMQIHQLARVFDRFYRSDEARSSQIGGHGIGLAIVKRLADVQNIVIKFESEPLKGTTAILQFHS